MGGLKDFERFRYEIEVTHFYFTIIVKKGFIKKRLKID